jgi:hypothetical protein
LREQLRSLREGGINAQIHALAFLRFEAALPFPESEAVIIDPN